MSARTVAPTERLAGTARLSPWPCFSDAIFLAVVLLKPLADALYEVGFVKYGYMLVLFMAALLAHVGKSGISRLNRKYRGPRDLLLLAVLLYFLYLTIVSFFYGGALHEAFKIVSPFIFYVLAAGVLSPHFAPALAIGSVLVVFGNACLLPFDIGWIYWGAVRTFRGYYYFKTDLAFAISTSVLMLATFLRFRLTPLLVATLLLGAVEVVLSNARLNYLIYGLVVLFIFWKNGLSISSLVKYVLVLGAIAATAFAFYDPDTFLSPFDFSNQGKFTQGRNQIWDILVTEGLMKFSYLEWLFGRGMWADLLLNSRFGESKEIHNAHNDLLHLLLTQGVVGLGLYLILWRNMLRDTLQTRLPSFVRGVPEFAIMILVLQSATTVVSAYATKTWPIVTIFLMVSSFAGAMHAHSHWSERDCS